MTEEKDTKDIVIIAYPGSDEASVEGGSADGMVFLNKKYGTTTKQTIKGKDVNPLLKEIRDNNLSLSFKAGMVL